MARITVEDCLDNVENRFVLVLAAAKRARQLSTTSVEPKVSIDNDKPTVLALREIAAGLLNDDDEDNDAVDGDGEPEAGADEVNQAIN